MTAEVEIQAKEKRREGKGGEEKKERELARLPWSNRKLKQLVKRKKTQVR
jgi:hypothetical protein